MGSPKNDDVEASIAFHFTENKYLNYPDTV